MLHKNTCRKNVKSGKNQYSADKKNKSFFFNEHGVSDVVGNILMVAITVIMASIIAVSIFGMKPPADVVHLSYKIEANGTNLEIMHMGGQQVKISDLKFMTDGVEYFNTTNSEINNTGIWKIGTTVTLNNTNNTDIMIVHLPSKELLQ